MFKQITDAVKQILDTPYFGGSAYDANYFIYSLEVCGSVREGATVAMHITAEWAMELLKNGAITINKLQRVRSDWYAGAIGKPSLCGEVPVSFRIILPEEALSEYCMWLESNCLEEYQNLVTIMKES